MSAGRIFDIETLRERTGVFADRLDAGRILAGLVAQHGPKSPLVLAIPAGGVPVAAAMADMLRCALDVAVVSKITLPWNTEAGYGAVAFDGRYQLNDALVKAVGLTAREIEEGIRRTRDKVVRRIGLFSGKQPMPVPGANDIVVVDDGLASGLTMLVCVTALRAAGAGSLSVAVPTGNTETVQRLVSEVDAVYCANLRSGRPFAVASAYRYWCDVSEEDALRILEKRHRAD